MNVDDAISEVNTNIRPNPRNFNPWYYDVAITIAAEVERLCAELAVEREAIKSLGNSFDKLRAELAAAKAASVCPVEASVYVMSGDSEDTYVRCRTVADGIEFRSWLQAKLQERCEQ